MLSELYCFVDCFVAMQQLLCRDAAIALSPCSNELCLLNRQESSAVSRDEAVDLASKGIEHIGFLAPGLFQAGAEILHL